MTQSIIFFDIDGTLLSEKTHTVPESTKLAIKEAQKNGHLLFINTGRAIGNIHDCITDLKFDGYICGCGTYIEFREKELLSKTLSVDFANNLIQNLRDCKLDAILEGKSGTYFDHFSYGSEVREIRERNLRNTPSKVKYYDEGNIDFDKLVIWTNDLSDFEKFHTTYKDFFEFIHRENNFYELVPLGFSKASGIEFLINYLDIPFENTFAIGDSTNDLAMLKYVKNSIAMGNSNAKLFDLVSYITSDIEQDGIYNALKHYDLI